MTLPDLLLEARLSLGREDTTSPRFTEPGHLLPRSISMTVSQGVKEAAVDVGKESRAVLRG